MSVLLLAPLFLLGLVAIAVPVIVHLIQRHKREVVAFPSLMFLTRIPVEDVRRQHLRDKLLFALRLLALGALAAAFAQPFIETGTAAEAVDVSGREVVILVDRSHSMRAGGRWGRALDAARDRAAAVTAGERATVVLFDDRAEVVTPTTADPEILRAALDRAVPTAGGTNYAAALQVAREILGRSEQPRREALLVSDFQGARADPALDLRLPPGTDVRVVDVADTPIPNLAVAHVGVRTDLVRGRHRVEVSTRLIHPGWSDAGTIEATLSLNDQIVARERVRLLDDGVTPLTFPPVPVAPGVSVGAVTAGTDALPQDNRGVFVVHARAPMGVLVVEPDRARAQQSLYVERALAISDAPRLAVSTRARRRLRATDLADRALVVFNDAAPPEGAVGEAVARFVRGGGGVWAVLGDRATSARWASADAWLPGRIGDRIDPRGGAVALTTLDYASPVLDVFRAPRSGDFTSARVFRYRAFRPDTAAGVLARFADGGVALVERRVGDGMVAAWTSSVDLYWTNMPLQPVFVPLVHRLVRHLTGYRDVRAAYTVGDAVDLGGPLGDPDLRALIDAGTDLVVRTPSGDRLVVRPGAGEPIITLREPGLYEVRSSDGSARPPARLAAQIGAAETDLRPVDREAFIAAITPTGAATAVTDGRRRTLTVAEREQRQRLWWYLLVGVVVVLSVESLVANRNRRGRLSRARAV